jgi:polar amino acid transport system permease protein
MLKTSSLASVVVLQELLFKVQSIYSHTFQTIPMLIVASLWYLAVTTVLVVGQFYIERYYSRGSSRQLPPTPRQRLLSALRIRPPSPGGRTYVPTPGLDVAL